jgi:hypothetical protein
LIVSAFKLLISCRVQESPAFKASAFWALRVSEH